MRYASSAIALALIGCLGPEVKLIDNADREASNERLRRMNITWERPDGVGGWLPQTDVDLIEIVSALQGHCSHRVEDSHVAFSGCDATSPAACTESICDAQAELCMALTAREMARTPTPMLLLDQAGNPAYRIPPQDVESQAGIEQGALVAVAAAIRSAGAGLNGNCAPAALLAQVGVGEEGGFQSPANALPQSVGEYFASTLVEALRVGEEASDRAALLVAGIADRDRTAISDRGRAARLTWFDTNLSRTTALQSLVGGLRQDNAGARPLDSGGYRQDPISPRYQDLVAVGVGAQQPCKGQCDRALSLLRISGAPFSDITDPDTTLDSLLNSQVIPRLTERFGRGPSPAPPFVPDVPRSAFAEARSWMVHEAAVFARPAGLPPVPIPPLTPAQDGAPTTPTYTYDPTTMATPTPPPMMHYITASRAPVIWDETSINGLDLQPDGWGPIAPLPRPERAYLFDAAHTAARIAIRNDDVDDAALGVLSTLVQQAEARDAARGEVCAYNSGGWDTFRIRAYNVESSDALIVRTAESLRCLTSGQLEGTLCAVDPLTVYSPTQTGTHAATAPTGWNDYVQWGFSFYHTGAPPKAPYWYILRRKAGAAHLQPGGYEAIAGVPWYAPTSPGDGDIDICITLPFDTESIPSNSTDTPGASDGPGPSEGPPPVFPVDAPSFEPSVVCSVPGPIPLEDEIIDDGDPYETSWRHHLTVASRAAAHADDLGQQLISSGLQIDTRAEQGLDELTELCGTSINLDRLFDQATGSSSGLDLTALIETEACDEAASMDCPAGYECVGTTCIAQVIAPAGGTNFDAEAVLRCLGLEPTTYATGPVVDVVGLGSMELCAWYRDDAPQIVCSPSGTGQPCPYVPGSGGCSYAPVDNTAFQITSSGSGSPSTDLLELFPRFSPDGTEVRGLMPPPEPPCEDLRELRLRTTPVDPASDEVFQRLRSTGFFTADNARRWASRIGWYGYPMNFGEFRVGGTTWPSDTQGSTGYPFIDHGRAAGPATGWPCGNGSDFPAEVATCGTTGSPPLFCSYVEGGCNDVDSRAAFNRRMGRAVATLGALSAYGLSQLQLPTYYEGNSGGWIVTGYHPEEDYQGGLWMVKSAAEYNGDNFRGWLGFPVTADTEVWRAPCAGGNECNDGVRVYRSDTVPDSVDDEALVNTERPFGFFSHDLDVRGSESDRADSIAVALWNGMGPYPMAPFSVRDTAFFGVISNVEGNTEEEVRAVVRNAILGGDRPEHTVLLDGRANSCIGDVVVSWISGFPQDWCGDLFTYGALTDGEPFYELSNLFWHYPFDAGGTSSVDIRFNRAHLFTSEVPEGELGSTITRRDVLDALELMCQVAASDELPPEGECGDNPYISDPAMSLPELRRYIDCVARDLDLLAQKQTVQGLPADVVAAVRGGPVELRPDQGIYGQTITELRVALRNQAEAPRQMARILRDVGDEIESLRARQRILDRQRTISYLGDVSAAVGAIYNCASSQYGAGCAPAAAQLGISLAVSNLERENLAENERLQMLEFGMTMRGHADNLETLQTQLLNGTDQVEAILARLHSARARARAALSRAAFVGSDAAGRQYAVNTVMRRSYDINLRRYEQAHAAAVRSAVVARAAIEQRFGVDLDDQACTSLADSPEEWAGDICNALPINYGALRSEPDVEVDPNTLRSMFVGDYVRRLEQWVESYRFDFPYTSGDDTVVMSLRDDFRSVRGRCAARADNLLGVSNDLRSPNLPLPSGALSTDPDATIEPAWREFGCLNEPGSNCVVVREASGPIDSSDSPRGFEVTFVPDDTSATDYTNDSAWVQEVVLRPGVYRLSWYASSAGTVTPSQAVDVRSDEATLSGPSVFAVDPTKAELLLPDWTRYVRLFRVPPGPVVTVRVGVVPAAASTPYPTQHAIVAGLSLEDASTTAGLEPGWQTVNETMAAENPGPFYPGPFVASTAQGYTYSFDCLTTDPVAFRESGWTYRCARLCQSGFADACGEGEVPVTRCYWETGFPITEERLLGQGGGFGGGLAFGNYNYRTGEVAVNLVGSGVLACDGPDARSCLATATVPYTLEHRPLGVEGGSSDTGYRVLTHTGDRYMADLRVGRIESARALTAERYITNPVSTADRALIDGFRRRELRGRPMPGYYILRLWDVPGFNFAAVEDVQLIWEYRYFTRVAEPTSCL